MTTIRVLLIEDDPDISDLLQAALEPTYECLRATNGLEGLQMVHAGEPDLIISDIMMPIMDGYEFIRRIRKEADYRETPVIFLSALGTREKIRAGYDLGAALYLTKPIDPVRMRRNVELFIEDHGVSSRNKLHTVKEVQETFSRLQEEDGQPPSESSSPESHASTSKENVAPVSGEPQKPRLMVVEDNRESLETLREEFTDAYEFCQAFDGIEAIERAVRYEPDLFVIDGTLPKMTGYQLVTMLKRNKIFYRHPIIMISEKASNRDRQYIEKLGVEHFLAKPFDPKELRQIVDSITTTPGFPVGEKKITDRQMSLEVVRDYEARR